MRVVLRMQDGGATGDEATSVESTLAGLGRVTVLTDTGTHELVPTTCEISAGRVGIEAAGAGATLTVAGDGERLVIDFVDPDGNATSLDEPAFGVSAGLIQFIATGLLLEADC